MVNLADAKDRLKIRRGGAFARIIATVILAGLTNGPPGTASAQARADNPTSSIPQFRADGPDALAYGLESGFPACNGLAYLHKIECRVGAFSQFDSLFPARSIARSSLPSTLRYSDRQAEIHYVWNGQTRTLDDYLADNPVTGFLLARGNSILVERYQYGRTDAHRLASLSMAKTIVGLLIGVALQEGHIASIDDFAENYVPALKGLEFGRTPIRALLQMASGIPFREDYSDETSDSSRFHYEVLAQERGGILTALSSYNTRLTEPGRRFSYSSADSTVLGLVLSGATRRTVSDYAHEKLWNPIGAEADATWIIDGAGQEIPYAFFNAVLRDWARLGLMLAHDGVWNGKTIIPRDWLLAATSIGPDSPFWSTSTATRPHSPGYGYQVWLLLADRRIFALRGRLGQFILVDPATRTVLVQTSIRDGAEQELLALWSAVLQPR